MKRNLTLIIFGILVLVLAAGCDRSSRHSNNPTSEPIITASSETPAQPAPAATDATAPGPRVISTSTSSVSESDQLAGQLDDALKEFDQQLGAVDSIEDTPPSP